MIEPNSPISEEEISLESHAVYSKEEGKLVLTKKQKDKIIEIWRTANKGTLTLSNIASQVFGREVDVRHPSMKLIKKFLAELDFNSTPKVTTEELKKESEFKSEIKIEPRKRGRPPMTSELRATLKDPDPLTEEHYEYLRNNYKTATVIDMCRILFKNPRLSKENFEVQKAAAYLESLDLPDTIENFGSYEEVYYSSPKTPCTCLARIKKYVPKIEWDLKNLNEKQKKFVDSLINFLSTLRYKSQIASFSEKEDQELFESEFIRCTYDKPDLAEEDIDLYVIYANEVVISKNINRSIGKWQQHMDATIEDEDNKGVKMAFVEAISTMRDEYNQSIKRQGELLKTLTTKRSDRISKLKDENASILTLVQAVKQEETRVKLIKISDKRQELLKEEVNRLMTMDEIKAQIWGISEEDIFNG